MGKKKKNKLKLYDILKQMGFYNDPNYEEKWIYINGERTVYKIRDNGEVISTEYQGHPRKVLLSMSGGLDKDGYHIVSLTHNGKKYTRKVHRLVAEAFIDNPDNKPEVNHKNGNKLDNRKSNLEWVYPDENTQHASISGLRQGSLMPESVEFVCVLLSTNAYSIEEIYIMSGVSKQNIIKIKNGITWKNISSKYDISNYNSKDHINTSMSGKRISDEIVLNIANDLVNNSGSLSEIGKRYDVSIQTVRRIYMRESHSGLTEKYDFSLYKKKTNQYC